MESPNIQMRSIASHFFIIFQRIDPRLYTSNQDLVSFPGRTGWRLTGRTISVLFHWSRSGIGLAPPWRLSADLLAEIDSLGHVPWTLLRPSRPRGSVGMEAFYDLLTDCWRRVRIPPGSRVRIKTDQQPGYMPIGAWIKKHGHG